MDKKIGRCKLKKIFFFISVVLITPYSVSVVFANDPIGPLPNVKTLAQPRRATESELKTFLRKLNQLKESYELVEFSPTDISVFKNICRDSKTKKLEDCGNSYHTLWLADINNDGKSDYVLTDEGEGSDHDDYLEIYDDSGTGKITSVEIPKFECDYTNIAKDLLSTENGKTYFRLTSFIAQDKNGEIVGGGANSNAAPGAYYSVVTQYKCLWSQDGVKVLEKKKSKEKFE